MTKALFLNSDPRIRIVISALALAAVALIVLAAISAGTADAARHEGYYPCWIEDYGWMWCKDV